jgi:hypothetical protein
MLDSQFWASHCLAKLYTYLYFSPFTILPPPILDPPLTSHTGLLAHGSVQKSTVTLHISTVKRVVFDWIGVCGVGDVRIMSLPV